MAMLAERKHKQKWSLNPRGKEWSQDSNKFGQKMLEKMGWKSGKGLGAKLDGMTEHVKVSHKHDNKGMGYKETEQWTQHDENFTKLLNSLAENSGVETIACSPESLEQASANSKKRVHYHKFTRGKDLTQYSDKQLANIFGKKALNLKNDDNNEINTVSSDETTKKYGVATLDGGSMVDYFKNKLGGTFVCKNGDFVIGNDGVLRKEEVKSGNSGCESDNGSPRPSCGFGFREDSEFIEEDSLKNVQINSSAKKSKKRKLKKNVNEVVYENAIFDCSINDSGEDCQQMAVKNPYEVKPKQKKKKINVSDDKSTKQHDEEKTSKTKKQKNNKITPVNDDELNTIVIKKKPKKNRQIVEISLDFVQKQTTDNSDRETPLKKVKKSKLNPPGEQTTSKENNTKKKRKKMGLENPNFEVIEASNSFVDVSSEFEVKRKNKKVKSGLDNPGLNLTDGGFDKSYEEGLSTSAQENLNCGFENFGLNTSNNDSTDTYKTDDIQCDLMLNITTLPSSAQSTQVERRKNVRFSGVNQQYIIPNNYENKLMEQKLEGVANAAFDERAATMEENMMDVEQHLSADCARVENDLNEVRAAAHARLLVPIVAANSGANICHGNAGIKSLPAKGNTNDRSIKTAPRENAEDFPEIGEKDHLAANQATANGDVRLSYKLASNKVTKVPHYLRAQPKNTDRSPYKHLVKGDIILAFKKTNLHAIPGYGIEETVTNVAGSNKTDGVEDKC